MSLEVVPRGEKGHLFKEENGLDRMVAGPTCRRGLALGYFRDGPEGEQQGLPRG